jgi:hypothetical protein
MPLHRLEQRRSRPLARTGSVRPRVEELDPRCLLNASNRLFAANAYQDLVQHRIAPDRLALYRRQLDHGVSRSKVVTEIESTPEYRSHLVQELYHTLFHQRPDAQTQDAALTFLAGGGTTEQLQVQLLGSSRYFERRGGSTDRGFLAALFHDVMQQPLDRHSLRLYGPLLSKELSGDAAEAARLQVAERLLSSVRAEQVLVQGLFQRFLHHPADGLSLRRFVGKLRHGEGQEQLIAVLVGSKEYLLQVLGRGHAGQQLPQGPPSNPPSSPQQSPIPAGPSGLMNVAVTTDPGVQQMPSVAVDPTDSRHVVIAYMDRSLVSTGYAGIGVAVSHDDGTTWQHTSIPLPAGFAQGAANPIARFDGQGHVFVSFMAATFLGPKPPLTNPDFQNPDGSSDRTFGFQANNGIFVSQSSDGGRTWNQAVPVVSHLYDGQHEVFFEIMPELAIDTFRTLPSGQPNPHYGNLDVVWTRIYPVGQFPGQPSATGGTDIMIAVSHDGGQTWQPQLEPQAGTNIPVTVIQDPINSGIGPPPGQGVVDQAHLAIGPEGDLYVSTYSFGDFTVALSTDGGASFVSPDHNTDQRIPFGLGGSTVGPGNGLPTNHFRTNTVRAIVADPARPGYVYAAEPVTILDSLGNPIDAADVFFARSTDNGLTWESTFQVGSKPGQVLNDDNGSQKATGSKTDVIAGQVFARMAVDAQGDLAVIWYDTRRDPANHQLDVFGTVSTDGGQTFSPNFRITNFSFDADAGRFSDATGKDNFYLGDFLGLAVANHTAYATWTDTRNGNQDIFFAHFPVNPAPAAPNDRFEPNNTAAAATDLGKVVQRVVPKLALPPGGEDWFRVQAAATGDLIVSADSDGNVPLPANTLRLQLWDQTGTHLLAVGSDLHDAAGNVLGQEVRFPGTAGQIFLVRVVRLNSGSNTPILYSLNLQSLTADLGTRVVADVSGTLAAGGQALYRLTAAAAGSLQAAFTNGANVQGNLNVQVLDADNFAVLSNPPPPPTIPSAEPNDALGQANDTGLVGPGSVQLNGVVGDGPFGTTSGDYDFYRLQAGASQRIAVTLVDPKGSSLDGVIVLYDSAGNLLQYQDVNKPGVGEFLSFVTTKADTYDVAIFGCCNGPPGDPFTPGTGGGAATTGPYNVTITTQPVGPGAVEQASVPVRQGQSVLLLVTGEGNSAGDYDLQVTNLDQFATPDKARLFFPAGAGPSEVALGHLRGPDKPLDMVVTNSLTNTLSVLLGNGDGTFQAPRQFDIGAFKAPSIVFPELPTLRRDVTIADLNGDEIPDVTVTNFDSGDISVLLGRGDGTFEPQRRFDATSAPYSLDVGDFNGDKVPDLVAIDSHAGTQNSTVAVLLGRGDGTFAVQHSFTSLTGGEFPLSAVRVADLNNDGKPDLVVSGQVTSPTVSVFLGNGDGTFGAERDYTAGRQGVGLLVADVNGDGIPDIVNEDPQFGFVSVLLGNGDGTFQPHQDYVVGRGPVAVGFADMGSQITLPDGSTVLGPSDGHPDLVVADSGITFASATAGGPGVVLVPSLVDSQGHFAGFGAAQLLAAARAPQALAVGDLNQDGTPDVAVVDRDGVLVVFGKRPALVPGDPNLGTVVHVLEPTLSIVPGNNNVLFTLTVPTEAANGADDEVLDFSCHFQALEGAGISMELRDAGGNLLGAGERFRVKAPQGANLTLRVFGLPGVGGVLGAGAYTLDIDVLPQVVAVEAQALLPGVSSNPGGPTASLVITLQGDRLDPTTAENPANYQVTWLGPDGILGTADDQVVPLATGSAGAPPVLYDPSANRDVASGTTFPTAVRQTVTLQFANPLPAGSYQVELLPAIQAAPFNADEANLLTNVVDFHGHPVVSVVAGQVTEGDRRTVADLVLAAGALGDLGVFHNGTAFLTQLHDDLAALLDGQLTLLGDAAGITTALQKLLQDRLGPALGAAGQRPTKVLALWLDPVSPDVVDPNGDHTTYDLTTGDFSNDITNGFSLVIGTIELFVFPSSGGAFQLTVTDVPPAARGGAVMFELTGDRTEDLTDPLRDGTTQFTLNLL